MVGWLYKYLISKKTKSIETIKNWKNHTANAIIPQIKSANHTKIIVGFSYLHSWKKKSLSTQLYSTIFNFILLLQFSWKFTFILFFFCAKTFVLSQQMFLKFHNLVTNQTNVIIENLWKALLWCSFVQHQTSTKISFANV